MGLLDYLQISDFLISAFLLKIVCVCVFLWLFWGFHLFVCNHSLSDLAKPVYSQIAYLSMSTVKLKFSDFLSWAVPVSWLPCTCTGIFCLCHYRLTTPCKPLQPMWVDRCGSSWRTPSTCESLFCLPLLFHAPWCHCHWVLGGWEGSGSGLKGLIVFLFLAREMGKEGLGEGVFIFCVCMYVWRVLPIVCVFVCVCVCVCVKERERAREN